MLVDDPNPLADILDEDEHPAKVEVPVSDADATFDGVEEAVAHLPVTVDRDETGITFRCGGKSLYASIKQPLHRIVATVEAFAGGGR